ncbi:hypothetical protein [Aliidongia dinghuensis]|uniref:hypothetical protein n=1 Tax=Aliidongia dinghuensis TaxID=1867774 RepID=UPI00166B946F|nr:hypothetical protein [Aliidongia dinghuensis]
MNMKALFSIATLLLMVLLGGCKQASTNIYSVKSDNYDHTPQSIFVGAAFGDTRAKANSGEPASNPLMAFRTRISSSLEACGIRTNVEFSEGNTATVTVPPGARDPEAILLIRLVSQTVSVGAPVVGAYHAEMIDRSSKKAIWQADITTISGHNFYDILAKSLIDRMISDKILPTSCAAS